MFEKILTSRKEDDVIGYGCLIFMLFFMLSIVGGICVVICQTYQWAKTGVWTPLPLSTILVYIGKYDLSSIYNPQSWTGLAKIAQWFLKIPISLCIPVVVGIITFFAYIIIENFPPCQK